MSTATRMKVSLFLVAIAAIVVVLSRTGRPSEVAASPPIQPQSAPYAPNCEPDWAVVPSPNWGAGSNFLNAVAALASNDVWAVGSYITGTARTLIEHWDGSAWSIVPSPNIGSGYNSLNGIAAIASNDIWAVGNYDITTFMTLIIHWDGSEWSIIPSPNVGTRTNSLVGVSAVSSDDVWAVGHYYDGTAERTLIEHWDGNAWSVVPSPNVGGINAVAAISSDDVWVVGGGILHWDGSEWSLVPGANISTSHELLAVDGVSSNDVWIVGYYRSETGIDRHTLTEHWDGNSWSLVPSPDANTMNRLYGIVAISSSDVWAVGVSYSGKIVNLHTLIEHWDGNTWTVVSSPNAAASNILWGVAAVASDDVWAVGQAWTGSPFTLVERYNPCPPTPTPTATPEPPRCPAERFTDVCPTDYFYQHVLDLNDLGVVSGYNTAPPCDGPAHVPCFKPYNWSTRGQIAKVVSLAAGFHEPVTTQFFEDVPPAHTFYEYIERMASRDIISGYPCGSENEPCIPPDNRPYFRPGNAVGRGQLSKMAVLAFGLNQPITTQTFEDVPPAYTFYEAIERLAVLNIISGYPCGSPEPCVPPNNRPYFRPGNNISRGQIAKIVNLARTQPTPTPTITLTPTLTPTPSYTPIITATPTAFPTNTPSSTATPTIGP
ncbi:MAG: S-layer homology domain-containing protein, partial [Chloroflexia bacterium]